MAVMDIIKYFKAHEGLKFRQSKKFYWNSKNNVVYYNPQLLMDNIGRQSLLHEIGHAVLGHIDYKFDMELLKMEIDAWKIAEKYARTFQVRITKNYLAESLNSYLNWVKSRATCPACSNFGLQNQEAQYVCASCYFLW